MRVLTWFDTQDTVPVRPLPNFISFQDEVPRRPDVFVGQLQASLVRYKGMAEAVWTMAFPASLFGPDEATAAVEYPNLAGSSLTLPITTTASQSVPGPSRTSTRSSQPLPCMFIHVLFFRL